MRFFPKELWSTIDPKKYPANGPYGVKASTTRQKREPVLPRAEGDIPKGESEDVVEDEEGGGEEVRDDEFEEEDEDDGDDYNAEQYFDGNQDEAGEEMDVDEGDGGGDYY